MTKKKKTYTAKEVAEEWKKFKPKMPLSYTLATLKAIRNKNKGLPWWWD